MSSTEAEPKAESDKIEIVEAADSSEQNIPTFDSSDSEDEQGKNEKNVASSGKNLSLNLQTKRKLKQIAEKAKAKIKGKRKKRTKKDKQLAKQKKRSVIVVSRLPWGFFESQLREFFEQFGDITRLRLCRSKKGNTQHKAFIEFKDNEVGFIAAESFNGLILGAKIVKAEVMPPQKIKDSLFKGHTRRGKKTESWKEKCEKRKTENLETDEEKRNIIGKKRKRKAENNFKGPKNKKLKRDYKLIVRTKKCTVQVWASKYRSK